MTPQLEPWSFQLDAGFSLRGWRSKWSGKPVIHFLHGNGFCGLTYQPLLEILAQDFDLLITDLPGHGDSDPGPRFAGWVGSANYAAIVLSHFSQQLNATTQVYGLGHSYGGVITALMAARNPNRYRKILLMDPVIFSTGMLATMKVANLFGLLRNNSLAQQARARNHQWPNREAAFSALQDKGGFEGWTDEALQAYVEHAIGDSDDGVRLKCSSKVEAKIYSSYPKGLWGYLKQMQVQCKILVAESSFPFIARSVRKLVKLTPYSPSRVAGSHCFMQQDPQQSAALIKEWFLDQKYK
ncbi:MAG: alpha/beta hydrolase [Bermanella sp.]